MEQTNNSAGATNWIAPLIGFDSEVKIALFNEFSEAHNELLEKLNALHFKYGLNERNMSYRIKNGKVEAHISI